MTVKAFERGLLWLAGVCLIAALVAALLGLEERRFRGYLRDGFPIVEPSR